MIWSLSRSRSLPTARLMRAIQASIPAALARMTSRSTIRFDLQQLIFDYFSGALEIRIHRQGPKTKRKVFRLFVAKYQLPLGKDLHGDNWIGSIQDDEIDVSAKRSRRVREKQQLLIDIGQRGFEHHGYIDVTVGGRRAARV